MKMFLLAILFLLVSDTSQAANTLPPIPPKAYALLPFISKTTDSVWPDIPYKSYVPAQIEQETCISLKSKGCFNSHTELKTSREYGFGLAQLTIAYRADGSERFNSWRDIKRADPALKNWAWEDRYNPELQIRALLVKNKVNYGQALKIDPPTIDDLMAFTAVWYNSGSPLLDRKICLNTKGCDPSRWFGHVELYSLKAKKPVKGYGKSFFDISREYPRNVIKVRRQKYIPYLDKHHAN